MSFQKLFVQADTYNSRNMDRWVRKREQRKFTLTTVGSHLLFVNSDMWPPIMTFKLREACTKLAQMLWPPWVGAALMMKKLYEGGMHSLASVEEACAQKRAQKSKNISKGALSALLES